MEIGAQKGAQRERGHDEAEARMPSRKLRFLRPGRSSSNLGKVGGTLGVYGSGAGTSGGRDTERIALRKRAQSVGQARGKPGDREALSIVPLLFLLFFP